MKFTLNKGNVTLTSETEAEALQLFGIAVKTTGVFGDVARVQVHKKHQHVKNCEVCNKGFKGLKGLNSHRSRMHGIRSEKYEINKKYYEKKKTPKFFQ